MGVFYNQNSKCQENVLKWGSPQLMAHCMFLGVQDAFSFSVRPRKDILSDPLNLLCLLMDS